LKDPCLTTWDAREVGSWLREVAARVVPPAPVADAEPQELLFRVAVGAYEETARPSFMDSLSHRGRGSWMLVGCAGHPR